MSNDLSAMLSHLTSESYDGIVKALCAPPPTGDPEETTDALATHVGQSNARLLAFVYVTSLLSEADKRRAVGTLSEWVLAIRSRRIPQERHVHEAEGDLLNMAAWLREGGVSI